MFMAELLRDTATESLPFLKMDQLQKLRLNLSDYVNFIYLFASCVVPKQTWKQFIRTFPSNPTADMFNKLLSISDEAFIIVVLLSYEERWRVELQRSQSNNKNLVVSKHILLVYFLTSCDLMLCTKMIANVATGSSVSSSDSPDPQSPIPVSCGSTNVMSCRVPFL